MERLLNVLLIDDSNDDRELCRRVLIASFGSRLSLAEETNGESGFGAIEKAKPHCVLLDYSLPGRNGIEVLKRIRSMHPHLPIILLTGQGSEAIAAQSIKDGAQDYIIKSEITSDTLSRAIRTAIENSTQKRHIDEQHGVEALLAAVVTSSSDAILSKTLDGTIKSWNTAAEELFGYSASDMIGQSIRILIPIERQDEENWILSRIAAGERVEHYETVRLCKDGRTIEVSVTISSIRDQSGMIIGASKIIQTKLSDDLYELANRMSSGNYFPPPVRRVRHH
jgi:PAS domain S-box-containing protein